MKKMLSLILIGMIILLSACGSNGDDSSKESTESSDSTNSSSDTVDVSDAEEIYKQTCFGCHGNNLEGASGPTLKGIGSKYSEEEIKAIIVNGQGAMPGGIVEDAEAEALAKWLAEKK
ncbi:cytochrome c [Bacillus carboniphilus]|uniref:Cytochrome c n=1 Tax=Bacillus carboniphilus TaxID=86663 RepID=A0ABY9JV05_9BACI|nr:cytochrome c [Bacillus carboniphilus]WLR41480.1 cytochrome c [Bacillus carboniphilus]